MRVNSINNQSFKALIVNRENETHVQRITINRILSNDILTRKLINNLENESSTDIVVSANPDGKTVKLSLSTTTDFLGLNYTPYKANGEKYETTITPTIKNNKINYRNIFMQTALFLKHAEKLDLTTPKNIEEAEKIIDRAFRE